MEIPVPDHEHTRTGMGVDALKRALSENLFYVQGRSPSNCTELDLYLALAYTVRDRLLARWVRTVDATFENRETRICCYLSAEFLLGPHLENNLYCLSIREQMKQAVTELGYDYQKLVEMEEEPGLGNGGLGRLAACFLDSLATLDLPAIGYGIRYEYGIFDQEIRDGWQVEISDLWLRYGNPWEIQRPMRAVEVALGGHTEQYYDTDGRYRVRWVPSRVVKGVPYDTPVLGYHTGTANLLRLWKSEAAESFDFEAFNVGDYFGAVEEKVVSENISKVLYPNDSGVQGKQLRLEQQYFFVSCSLQDALRAVLRMGLPPSRFHERYAFQLNDTHPAIGVAELMRLLVDVHGLDWDQAWDTTRRTFSYTNHTLLPEALERWPLPLFASVLPRHLEIIYEINRRFIDELYERFPNDPERIARMSLIDEQHPKYVRMAHLAALGSNTVNGVAALHTRLLKSQVMRDFDDYWPGKFVNVTNGVTPRRWLLLSNPRLSALITGHIGDGWVKDLEDLRRLEPLADDAEFRAEWSQAQLEGRRDLARFIEQRLGILADPESMYDVLVKRIHEYKRQHLLVLAIIAMFLRIKDNPDFDVAPRTFIFGGKAAPGYTMAKLIIKLIHSVGEVVNHDPDVRGRLKVVFLPDYNVTLGQRVYPAADLSEQISMAGKEASGTGNMKFSMNGALTIGTLDGANVEIREAVGEENFFLFGHSAEEVQRVKAGGYYPHGIYETNELLRRAIDALGSGWLSRGDRGLFRPLIDSLLWRDEYLVLADFASYLEQQDEVSAAWRDQEEWMRKSILNTARMGRFSSDRSIREYAEKIWKIKPLNGR